MINSKITIKHFLNKNLKPISLEGRRAYSVYSLITFKRTSTQLKFFKTDGSPLNLSDTEKKATDEKLHYEFEIKEKMIKKCLYYFVSKEIDGNLLLYLRKNISLLYSVEYFINVILFKKIQKHYVENNSIHKNVTNQMASIIDQAFKVIAQQPDVEKLLNIIYTCDNNSAKILKNKFEKELYMINILQNMNEIIRKDKFSEESFVIQFENGEFNKYFNLFKFKNKAIYRKYVEIDGFIKSNYIFNSAVNQKIDNKMDFID